MTYFVSLTLSVFFFLISNVKGEEVCCTTDCEDGIDVCRMLCGNESLVSVPCPEQFQSGGGCQIIRNSYEIAVVCSIVTAGGISVLSSVHSVRLLLILTRRFYLSSEGFHVISLFSNPLLASTTLMLCILLSLISCRQLFSYTEYGVHDLILSATVSSLHIVIFTSISALSNDLVLNALHGISVATLLCVLSMMELRKLLLSQQICLKGVPDIAKYGKFTIILCGSSEWVDKSMSSTVPPIRYMIQPYKQNTLMFSIILELVATCAAALPHDASGGSVLLACAFTVVAVRCHNVMKNDVFASLMLLLGAGCLFSPSQGDFECGAPVVAISLLIINGISDLYYLGHKLQSGRVRTVQRVQSAEAGNRFSTYKFDDANTIGATERVSVLQRCSSLVEGTPSGSVLKSPWCSPQSIPFERKHSGRSLVPFLAPRRRPNYSTAHPVLILASAIAAHTASPTGRSSSVGLLNFTPNVSTLSPSPIITSLTIGNSSPTTLLLYPEPNLLYPNESNIMT